MNAAIFDRVVILRLYSRLKPFFTKEWRLSEIEFVPDGRHITERASSNFNAISELYFPVWSSAICMMGE